MTSFRWICRTIALPLAAVMLLTSAPLGAVRAGMVPTEDVIGTAPAEADRETVNGFLAREEAQDQLRALGVDPAEASRRVAALSNEELRMIASRINVAPAGGQYDKLEDLEDTADFVALTVLIVLVVLLVAGYLISLAVEAAGESADSEAPDSDEPTETPDVPSF